MVCTGARDEILAKIACRKFARMVQKLGNVVTFSKFKVQNIVAKSDVKFTIDLENICEKYGQFCNYEPEVFPGLVY